MVSHTAFQTAAQAGSIGLYVHMPWCVKKCPYCDFNSHEIRSAAPEDGYVDALLRDLDYELKSVGPFAVSTIYIGGGTPSLFSGRQIARLLRGVRAAAEVSADAEITMEANPGALEAARFGEYRDAGVNRVSIGVQSLRDEQLLRLGRVHRAAEARAAVAGALAAGFDSVNLDLMYGLPYDNAADGLQDLKEALALGTAHLSWYQLTLEPNTAWERRPPAGLPDDEIVESIELEGRRMLADAGFVRYEVSAYARPGHQCAHNLNYWCFGDYVGIGAGAHSKRRASASEGYARYSRRRNPGSFARNVGKSAAIESHETVNDRRAIVLEYLMNALRLTKGTTLAEFEATTGVDSAHMVKACTSARREGLMSADQAQLCASATGYAQLNRILRMIG
jgi:putative oxygen-independent coproporphyrinogen III oxidase